ncbi:MAG TPA: energy transducer TonB, partial [Blastocatellia bacterium]|nr:energy transducer TonB [Blastocatellia bacterium]
RLSPPEKPALSPPSVSKVASDSTAPLSLPSDFKVSGPGKSVNQEPPPAPEKPIAEGPPAPKVIRRSSDVLQNTAIVRSRPVYPEEAKKEKIKGPVTVEVTINEEGSVIAARPVSGPRQLHDSALAAARRWKWLPARLDRSRARVVGTITLEFR